MSLRSLILLRLISLFALAVCSASLSDFLLHNSAYCDVRGGCSQVTASVYGKPLGIPLPIVGLVGFVAIFALTLWPNARCRLILLVLSIAAGLAGLALILIQVLVLQKICPLCVCADSAGIAVMITACLTKRRESERVRSAQSWKPVAIWSIVAFAAIVTPLLLPASRTGSPLPPAEVRAMWIEGQVNVVEITDFDCPHCARADKVVKTALRDAKNVYFIRVPAPMPTHEHSWPAARAYLAARQQGKGEEMAELLYATEPRNADRCRRLAESLQLRMDDYDRAIVDRDIDAELNATNEWAQRAGRLPVIWVQDQMIAHVPTLPELQEAIQRAVPFGGKAP